MQTAAYSIICRGVPGHRNSRGAAVLLCKKFRREGNSLLVAMNMSAHSECSQETIRRDTRANFSKVYVTASDLLGRYVWAACTVGFAYRLDSDRLRSAMGALVDYFYPVLTSRYYSCKTSIRSSSARCLET